LFRYIKGLSAGIAACSRIAPGDKAIATRCTDPGWPFRGIDREYGRKRRAGISLTKPQPAANEVNFRLAPYPFMKPASAGAGGDEQHDQRAPLRCLETLADPCADSAAIGRIAEHPVRSPILLEPVTGQVAFFAVPQGLRVK
jgi:hypothetical protein